MTADGAVARPPARRISRPLLVALAIVVGLGAGLVLDVARTGGPLGWLARHGLGGVGILAYRAEGRLVTLPDGRRLYLDCRGVESPTVVLVGGLGAGAETWTVVQPALAATTRTCAYDRPGVGRSDAGTTADHATAAADLQALLAAAGEGGPFVLVGHSLGADMARVMASADRARVLGLGLIDGFEPDLFNASTLPLLGPYADAYAADQAGLWELVSRTEGLDRERSLAQLDAADLVGRPIEVVIAARAEPRLDAATNAAIVEARNATYDALSPGRVRVTTAYSSGHMVQFDRPELVIEAIGRLVAEARSES
jgi:pimeloyl-ACP methyl ester carboxylesterase